MVHPRSKRCRGGVHASATPVPAETTAVVKECKIHAVALEHRGRFDKHVANHSTRDVRGCSRGHGLQGGGQWESVRGQGRNVSIGEAVDMDRVMRAAVIVVSEAVDMDRVVRAAVIVVSEAVDMDRVVRAAVIVVSEAVDMDWVVRTATVVASEALATEKKGCHAVLTAQLQENVEQTNVEQTNKKVAGSIALQASILPWSQRRLLLLSLPTPLMQW